MDTSSSTTAAPQIPAQPHQSTLALSGHRLAAGDVERACHIAQAAVAIAFGQPQPGPAAAPPRARAAAFNRQIAMYLAHVGFGLPMAQVGKALGRDRTTVVHACHVIEDRRDEARFDVLLDLLEKAAVALEAASRLNRQA